MLKGPRWAHSTFKPRIRAARLQAISSTVPAFGRFPPSLAFVIGFADSMAFLIGALAAHFYAKRSPKDAERYVVPVSSGIIAGESIMGIIIALLGAFKIL